MNKLIAVSLLTLFASSGCAVRLARHDGPVTRPAPREVPAPAPAPVVQRMGYDEAVSRAMGYAESRGYSCRLKEAHLTGNDVWKVKLEVARADAKGKLHLELDAYSREVLRTQENVKFKKPKHQDNGKGRGRHHAASAVAEND